MTQKTLRDEIAMAALTGLLANPECNYRHDYSIYVREAMLVADAFLAARGEQKKDDEWIEWKGGNRPVHSKTEVTVKYRDGDILTTLAGNFLWFHDGEGSDIIAYRVVEAPHD